LHRKHERGPKIFGIILTIALTGCCFSSYAKNTVKNNADEYEIKIEEKHLALDSIKSELIKGREKLKQLQQEEGSYVSQLEQLDKNIGVSQTYVERVSVKIDSISVDIVGLESSLTLENKRLADRQREMTARLRYIYKTGQSALPQIVSSSRDISDLLHRVRYFEALNRYDKTLLSQIDSARLHIGDRKMELEKRRERLSFYKQEKQKEYGELVGEQASRQKLLEGVRSRKAVYAAMIKELEISQKEIKTIVAMLESKRKKTRSVKEQVLLTGFEKRKGSLPWPVEGTVTTEFGKLVHSVYKTVVMNTGIDISAAKGDKVRCIASGKVAYVGWMRGFGKFAIVDHGGYYTTYAHMDEVAVEKDDDVKNGSIIGDIGGESGILGETKLHFEIRKSTEALDPIEWLEKKRK
jgi:septal ring factor EnvC (AmiA/AmiB activator)